MRKNTRSLILKLHKELKRKPKVVIFIFPGQPPGKYFPEHDRRIMKAIQLWQECLTIPCKVTILCTSGEIDRNGLTSAQYMKNQLIYFSKRFGLTNIIDYIEIGEEESGSTGQQIIFAKQDIEAQNPDLVILVSNWWHLLVAASFYKRLVGGRFVKEWSENADGCIGMPLRKFIKRQIIYYLTSITVNRSGELFKKMVSASIEKWRKLEYPAIPPTL